MMDKDRNKAKTKIKITKEEALAAAMAQIEKQFGKGSIMRLGDAAKMNIDVIPTEFFPLDIALGVGESLGVELLKSMVPESSGKTTVALHIVAEAQKMGSTAALSIRNMLWILSKSKLGVDINELSKFQTR